MNTVLVAPAKLTLSLRITGVRDDGLHLIEAEMVSLDLADRISVGPGNGLEVHGAGGGLEVVADDDNLVSRALALVGRRPGWWSKRRSRPERAWVAGLLTPLRSCAGPALTTS